MSKTKKLSCTRFAGVKIRFAGTCYASFSYVFGFSVLFVCLLFSERKKEKKKQNRTAKNSQKQKSITKGENKKTKLNQNKKRQSQKTKSKNQKTKSKRVSDPSGGGGGGRKGLLVIANDQVNFPVFFFLKGKWIKVSC